MYALHVTRLRQHWVSEALFSMLVYNEVEEHCRLCI